ncbi:MAG TPA: hypothetical protein VN736_21775 [Candidatus Limnocylindrales bacterium]|nr:hypothetical protein [Candidatus Limnocylindrales bacterium]
MKAQLFVITMAVTAGMAIAQTTPAQTPPTQTTPTQTTPAAPQTETAQPTQMKTSSFRGVLVDLSCGPAATTSASTASAASANATPADNSANRSTTDSAASCPVTANSSQIGMKLDDGRTVRFDLVGQQRAQDALKNEKHWSKDLAAGKPIHAKVIGVMSGEKLIVSSIH